MIFARWPLLHFLAMAAVATAVAALFWATFTESLPPYVAAVFAVPPAIVLLKAPKEAGPQRNRLYVMAWVLLAAMLVVFSFLSSGAL